MITIGICKCEIISKWKICCVLDNVQNVGNFEESLSEIVSFDTKTLYVNR